MNVLEGLLLVLAGGGVGAVICHNYIVAHQARKIVAGIEKDTMFAKEE